MDEGIYFLNTEADFRPTIEFFKLATRQLTPIAVLDKEPSPMQPGLAVSRDGQWILYAQVDQIGSGIMLVENFR